MSSSSAQRRAGLQRELAATLLLNQRSSAVVSRQSSFRDGWIDRQLDLNNKVTRIALLQQQEQQQEQDDPCSCSASAVPASSVTAIKVMQTFSQRISIHRLLETLAAGPHAVETLALVGIPIGAEQGEQLARVLTTNHTATTTTRTTTRKNDHDDFDDSKTRKNHNPIRSLQLCRLLPAGLPPLCRALMLAHPTHHSSCPAALTELRLTFDHDLTTTQTKDLLAAMSHPHSSLQVIKLYRLDLVEADVLASLAQALRQATRWKDLRLTGCHLGRQRQQQQQQQQQQRNGSNNHNDQAALLLDVARAISETNRLQRLDLSMNCIADPAFLSWLLQTPSLQSICLSQNQLGSCTPSNCSSNNCSKTTTLPVSTALAQNRTLERLFLDMNPLQQQQQQQNQQQEGSLAQELWHGLQSNTSLQRLGLLSSVPALNQQQQEQHDDDGNSSTNHNRLPLCLLEQMRHLVALNEAGRGVVRLAAGSSGYPHNDNSNYNNHQHYNYDRRLLLPRMLARVRREPDLIWGLLREHPALWANSG